MNERGQLELGDRVIYEITISEEMRRAGIDDDSPEAYRVVANPKNENCGIIVHGLYRGKWVANSAARWLVRHLLEELRKLRGGDDHPEHRCDRCGGRNIVWHADSDLWNRVADEFSILCPICFVELAKEKGIEPTSWLLSSASPDP